jgi:predicted ATPase
MIKHNFYVVTGGPGAGKTSVLENLASKGYGYIPETARQIIKERLSKGLTPRPDPETFAEEIFNKDWMNFTSNSDVSSPLFFDRSFMDSACMLSECPGGRYHEISQVHSNNRFNNSVFLTPPWKEIYLNDTERDQSFEESIDVYERLDKWYRQHGYDIVVLPKDTIENRVKFILDHLTQ